MDMKKNVGHFTIDSGAKKIVKILLKMRRDEAHHRKVLASHCFSFFDLAYATTLTQLEQKSAFRDDDHAKNDLFGRVVGSSFSDLYMSQNYAILGCRSPAKQ